MSKEKVTMPVAKIRLIERLDAIRVHYLSVEMSYAPDCPKDCLAYSIWEDDVHRAKERVESLTNAVSELQQLEV